MQKIVCTGVFEDQFVCWFQKLKILSCWADNNVHGCSKNTIQGVVFIQMRTDVKLSLNESTLLGLFTRFSKSRSGSPQQDAHPTVVSGHFSTGGNAVRSADKGQKSTLCRKRSL